MKTEHNEIEHNQIDHVQAEHLQCLIIGAGPAGYTAAIYAARAGLKPVLYTGLVQGGQLTITNDVENYPGFPDGINGPLMMDLFAQQAQRFGTQIRYGMVTHVNFSTLPHITPHRIVIDHTTELTADTVIIATGASAKWLGLPSEKRLTDRAFLPARFVMDSSTVEKRLQL